MLRSNHSFESSNPRMDNHYAWLPPSCTLHQGPMARAAPRASAIVPTFGFGVIEKILLLPLITNNYFRYVVDPYAILALLGFLVFLFYIIYSFLNNTGNGGRSIISDYLSEQITEDISPSLRKMMNRKTALSL